jgi:hypothetical protein
MPQPPVGPDIDRREKRMDRTRRSGRESRTAAWLLASCIGAGLAGEARADAVTNRNGIADSNLLQGGALEADRFRILAMTQLAVHDALNAIDPRFESYGVIAPANPGASPEAAVAAATNGVLKRISNRYSHGKQLFLAEAYASYLESLPPCPTTHPTCKQEGIAVGDAAAAAIIAMRYQPGPAQLAIDGSRGPGPPYVQPADVGVWQPTPPDFTQAQYTGWGNVTPFALRSGAQFRLDRSDILDPRSDLYARDYAEVRRVGAWQAEASGDRSPAQSMNAHFWPVANWNTIARQIVEPVGLDLWQNARLFALLDVAQADGAVAAFDTKYHYDAWRPVSAIRRGDEDGNPATIADPAWLPYMLTPAYPGYGCVATVNSGAASTILQLYFRRDDQPFSLTSSDSSGPVSGSFETLSQARAAAEDARVYQGVNFRSACVAGTRQGEQVARFVFQHVLRARPPRN